MIKLKLASHNLWQKLDNYMTRLRFSYRLAKKNARRNRVARAARPFMTTPAAVESLEPRVVLTAPVGVVDFVKSDGTIQGWAYDPNTPSQSVYVDLYVDGKFDSRTLSAVPRPDVNTAFNITGTHGFLPTISSTYYDGKPHNWQLYALDTSGVPPNPSIGSGTFTLPLTNHAPSVSNISFQPPGFLLDQLTATITDPDLPAGVPIQYQVIVGVNGTTYSSDIKTSNSTATPTESAYSRDFVFSLGDIALPAIVSYPSIRTLTLQVKAKNYGAGSDFTTAPQTIDNPFFNVPASSSSNATLITSSFPNNFSDEASPTGQGAFYYPEKTNQILSQNLTVSAKAVGNYVGTATQFPAYKALVQQGQTSSYPAKSTIAQGTSYSSFIVNFDPVTDNKHLTYVQSQITFPNLILGVISTAEDLQSSDSIVGRPTTIYSDNGLEVGDGQLDSFRILPDGHTIAFAFRAHAQDMMRVITQADPPPPPVNQPPQFLGGNSFGVSENQLAVGQVLATDPDYGPSSLRFSVDSGSLDGQLFSITPSGALSFITPPDFEKPSDQGHDNVYDVNVSVSDGSASVTRHYVVGVTNVNESPQIAAQTFSLAEHSSNGTVVGRVAASDPDAGDIIHYSIPVGNDPAAFTISDDGVLTVRDSTKLDYLRNASLNLNVNVTDAAGLSASNTVTVNLTPQSPSIPLQSFSVAENTGNGKTVGTVVVSNFAVSDLRRFDIIGGNDLGGFAIDSLGIITVADSTKLDFETTPVFHLVVSATNLENLTGSNVVTISLTNVNEAPTIASQSFTLPENSSNGTIVGTVIASDVDLGDTVTLTIVSGNDLNAFSMSSAGVISVADWTKLDFESNPTFSLTVRATDTGNLSASALVTIKLLNVNEAPTLSGMELTSLTYSGPSLVTSKLTVFDVDSQNLAGATIQISGGYRSGSDSLLFANTPNISGAWNSTSGILTLTGTDTLANYQAALRSIQFVNSSTNTSARTITFKVSDGDLTSNTVSRTIDAPPRVLSIGTVGPNMTTGPSVQFTITFSEDVKGVDSSDFTLVKTGTIVSGQTLVTSVSPSVYSVTVNGVTGTGTLGLNLINDGTIRDLASNLLATAATGPSYSIAPAPVITIQPVGPTVTAGSAASFTAAATSSSPVTIQWQVSSRGSSIWNNVSGATSNTYSFVTSLADNGNVYRAVFTNPYGATVTNPAVLNVLPAHVASVYWVGLGDGHSWNSAANWSTRAIPGPTDDVLINAASGTTINGPAVATTVGSLTIMSAKMTVATANLTVTNDLVLGFGQSLTLSGRTLSAGSISLNDSTLALQGSALIQGGTVTATGTGSIVVNDIGVLDSVTVNGNVSVVRASGNYLRLKNTVTMNGTLLIGSTDGLSYESLQLGDGTGTPVTLTGNATVVLGSNANNAIVNTVIGGTATLGTNVTVRGSSGLFYNGDAGGTFLIQGTLVADVSGGTISAFARGTYQNTGTLSASNGGTLKLPGTWTNTGEIHSYGTANVWVTGTMDNTGAAISGDGTLTLQSNGSIKGGIVNETGSIVVYDFGVLDSVTVNGNVSVVRANGNYLRLKNTVTLNGTLLIGSTDGLSYESLQLGDGTGTPVTLTGNATVVLGSNVNNAIVNTVIGGTATLGTNVTVRGSSGLFYNGDAGGTFLIKGTLVADVSGGTISAFARGTYQNTGTLSASNGGTLKLPGTWTNTGVIHSYGTANVWVIGTMDNTGAAISGDGTLTLQSNGTIKGGIVNDTGSIVVYDFGVLDSVTVNGNVSVVRASGNYLRLKNTVTLNGTLLIGSTDGLSYDSLQLGDGTGTPVTLTGNATVVLGSNVNNAIVNTVIGGTATLGTNVTVRGSSGLFYNGDAGGTFLNQGTLVADVSGGTISAFARGTYQNTGTLSASNGGTLKLPGTWTNLGVIHSYGTANVSVIGTMDNTGAAISGDGTLTLQSNGLIKGGIVNETGSIVVYDFGVLDSVTVNGNVSVVRASGNYLRLKNTVTLNGTLLIGSTDGLSYDSLQLGDGNGTPVTLTGNATVVLGGNANNAIVNTVIGGTATLGTNVTVRGSSGLFYNGDAGGTFLIQGTLVADVSGGTIGGYPRGTYQNTGTLSATNGGTLKLPGTWTNTGVIHSYGTANVWVIGTMDNTGAAISGDGTLTLQSNGLIKGGIINETGSIVVYDYGVLDSVTVNGNVSVVRASGNYLRLKNTVTLNGTLLIGSTDGLSYDSLQLGDGTGTPVTLTGNATVVLGGNANNAIVNTVIGGTATLGSTVTVRGSSGLIYNGNATGSFLVQGTVAADVSGGTITLGYSAGTYQNTGTLAASNGGKLVVTGAGTTNLVAGMNESPTGTIQLTGSLLTTATSPSSFNPAGVVTFNGAATAASARLLEAPSQDFGAVASGFVNNSAFGSLNLTSGTYVKLVDQSRNTTSSLPEAVYTNSINVASQTTLDLNHIHLYTRTSTMNGTIVNGSITVVPASSTPAVVTGISLGWGSSNSPALIDASGGRLLPAGRTNDMGWFNISRINVTLDHAVSSLNAADISVIGLVGGSYGPVTVTGSGTTWTIALAAPIANADKLILTISNTVTYQRQLDILPGDVDDDGTVTSADLTLVNIAISAPYSNFADMNGNGFIDLDDVALVRGKIGTKRIL